MLRAGAKTDKGYVMIAGITDGNIERLKAGFPINAEFKSFGLSVAGSLVIFHGKDEKELENQVGGFISDDTKKSFDAKLDQHNTARDHHKHILIGTVGLPRSGKTTWAKSQAYPIVNPDSIRLALHGQRFVAVAEPYVWAIAKTMVRALFLAGHKHVLLDATNTTRKRRDEWLSPEWGTFWHEVKATPGECMDRAAGDVEIILVITRMADSFEKLEDAELRW